MKVKKNPKAWLRFKADKLWKAEIIELHPVCEGCISIKHHLFPFTGEAESDRKGEFIDQEGCGIEGRTYLEIKYCPVCGKKQQ